MWLLYTSISAISAGFLSICVRKSKNSDGIATVLIGVMGYNLAFILIGLFRGLLSTFSWEYVKLFFPIFVLHITSDIFVALTPKFARITVTAPFGRLRAILPFIYSYIFFQERLSGQQIFFSSALIILSVLSTLVDKKSSGGKLERGDYIGIIMTLIMCFCNATYSFMVKVYVVQFNDPFIVHFYICSMSSIALVLFAAFTGQLEKFNFNKFIDGKAWFLGYILLNITSGVANKLSYVGGPISIITVLQGSSIIIQTLGARILLKEEVSNKKYIIIFLVFVCSVALSFFS